MRTTDVNSVVERTIIFIRQMVAQNRLFAKLLLFSFFVFLSANGECVNASAPAASENLLFKRLMPEDGLPAAVGQSIIQDSRGFMWFGTSYGLVRYDGHEFRIYRNDPKDPASLCGNEIWDLAEDSHGDIWIATRNDGLDCWSRNKEQFIHFRHDPNQPKSLISNAIKYIAINPDGKIWIGSEDAGLGLFDPQTGLSENFPLASPNAGSNATNAINTICLDTQGRVWVGTDGSGVAQLNPLTHHYQFYFHDEKNPNSLVDNKVTALAKDSKGNLWIGTSAGLCRMDPQRRTFERYLYSSRRPGSPQPRAYALMVDKEGNIWIGSDDNGLTVLDPATAKYYTYRNKKFDPLSLMSDTVRSICQDRTGDLWVGTYPSGVSHANRLNSPFHTHLAMPSDDNEGSQKLVSCFLEDEGGTFWIGTDGGGLAHIDPANSTYKWFRKNPNDPKSLGGNNILAMLHAPGGQIWVGSWDGGLYRLNPHTGNIKRFASNPGSHNSLGSTNIWRLAQDQQKRLWIGTAGGGLDRYDPATGQMAYFRHDPAKPDSLSDDYVWSLLISRNGTVWVGTRKGLNRWKPKTENWEHIPLRFDQIPAVPSALITDLLEDQQGQIWIGSSNIGLFKLDPLTLQTEHFSTADGFPSDRITGILEDRQRNLWVSTNEGLLRWDPTTRHCFTFDHAGGILSRQFFWGARLALSSGELLFGGPDGFVLFDPREVETNLAKPTIVLTRLEISGQEMRPGMPGSPLTRSITESSRLEIPASRSDLTFQMAVLNFRAPKKNICYFKLEGYDTNWKQASPDLKATYTNLDPGSYTLRIKAKNNHGFWSEKETTLDLIIVPPFYRTLWFRGSMAGVLMILLFTGGWSISHYRLRRRMIEAEREKQIALERQKAADALQKSEKRFSELADLLPQTVFETDVQGVLTYINHQGLKIYGLTSDDFQKGIEVLSTFAPQDRERSQQIWKKIATQMSSSEGEYLSIRKDGTSFPISIYVSPILQDGRFAGMRGIIIDNTERQKLHEQLLHAQKMEAVGQLAGGIAHDLNNMLAPILGYCELLEEDLPPNSPFLSSVSEIHRAGERSRDLVRQLLAFARKQTLEFKRLQLNAVIDDFVKLLRRTLREDVAIETHLEPDLPGIKGDARQIEQILLNLSINAQDAMPSGGRLIIETSTVVLDEEYTRQREGILPGAFVLLTVSDTGGGIDKETLGHIFEPFFTTKERGKGTGLGLATVFGIAKQHGGHISVYSEMERGTTVRIYFPVSDAAALALPDSAPANGETKAIGHGTILLVEDEEQVRTLSLNILQRAGYTTLHASDGKTALEQFRSYPGSVHLLLTDLVLPDTNGKLLYEQLSQISPFLKVLYMSGYTANVISHHGVLDEEINFIQKPFSANLLSTRVKEVLEKG